MLPKVDYDDRQHRAYAEGRRLDPGALGRWMEIFAAHAPSLRPLSVLDLGSGTGRFAPALADTFGGVVFGVEPSQKMRATAETMAAHPRVTYLAGSAEAIPLPATTCDVVLMFLSFHHVRDRAAAAREIARVLRPEGRVFIRSTFSDRMPDLAWHHYFARAREIEMQMFPTTGEVVDVFAAVGLRPVALVTLNHPFAPSLAEHAARLRLRAISTFEHLTEDEIEEGFQRLEAAVARERKPSPVNGASDLLVLG